MTGDEILRAFRRAAVLVARKALRSRRVRLRLARRAAGKYRHEDVR